MKDDPEVKAGWGKINLNWLFKPWAWLTIVWHDNITAKDSFAAKACISGRRIAENFGEQLRHISYNVPRNGWRKLVAKISGDAMPTLQPPFYDGPENDAERQECLKRENRNQDGTKRQ